MTSPSATCRAHSPRKPPWIRTRLGRGPGYARVRDIVRRAALRTVCEDALCPNIGRCWEKGRATLMILGAACTRACAFCNVASGRPAPPDSEEPARVAAAVKAMRLTDVVITSVTRDDLADGGAGPWAETLRRVHEAVPGMRVEALIPDFGGSVPALEQVISARPAVLGHNLETVPSLYGTVRPQADYARSLEVLRRGHRAGTITKTAVMVGLGENADEILALMRDVLDTGCRLLFVGQYLQPTRRHRPVARYVTPAEFDTYREQGLAMGFAVVVSGPLVRSSLYAEEQNGYVEQQLSRITPKAAPPRPGSG